MKKKFLKYFIMCTAVIFFMSSVASASSYYIPVWSSQNNKLNESYDDNAPISTNNVLDNSITNTFNTDSREVNTEAINTETLNSLDAVTNNPLNLTCGGAILIEQNSGKVLYDYNMHEKLRPASVTKVMTVLLIMEALDSGRISLTDKVPCSERASKMGGSQIWLDTTEELTVDEMLKAICVVSANDCTVAMAEYLEGSEEAFIEKMNKRAKELGMNDTTFKNCHGIDEDGHVTSAYDIALMSRELLNNHPSIMNYTTIWMDTLRNGESELVNTNKLIRNYKGATGLKTGSTSVALYNLSASATRDGLSLIAVIMKAPTTKIRFAEAQKLLDYGFSNYQYKLIARGGDILKEVEVNKGVTPKLNLVIENDVGILVKKGEDKNIEQIVNIDENISAPITHNQKLGEIIFTLNGQEIGKSNLIAEINIEKRTFFNIATNVYQNWFNMLRT